VKCKPSGQFLNAYAERFVRSIKRECPGKLVPLGENHLRTAVQEYTAHYHTERNHQGLEGRLIEPPANAGTAGPIVGRGASAGSCASTTGRRPDASPAGLDGS
jgi:putative transposase